jgi:hypothetical protein
MYIVLFVIKQYCIVDVPVGPEVVTTFEVAFVSSPLTPDTVTFLVELIVQTLVPKPH